LGARISQRVARNRRQHPSARGCGHFESPGLGKRKADADFRARFAASPTAGALLLDVEAVRRARDGVRRMKFNPKTGAPYIDPGTGEPYVEHEYSDMPLLRSSGITSRSTEKPPEGNVSQHVHNRVSPERQKQLQERHQAAFAKRLGTTGSPRRSLRLSTSSTRRDVRRGARSTASPA
jgi:hypothetical protein